MAKKNKQDLMERVGEIFDSIGANNAQKSKQLPAPPKKINLTEYADPDDNLMTAIITQHKIKHIIAFKADVYKSLNQCTAQAALMVVDKKKYDELKESLSKAIGEEIDDENPAIKTRINSWLADNRYKEGRDKFNMARDEYINELRQLTYNTGEIMLMRDNIMRQAYELGLDDDNPNAVKYMYAFTNASEKELERRERMADKKAGVNVNPATLAPAIIISGDNVNITYKEDTDNKEVEDKRIPDLTATAFFTGEDDE